MKIHLIRRKKKLLISFLCLSPHQYSYDLCHWDTNGVESRFHILIEKRIWLLCRFVYSVGDHCATQSSEQTKGHTMMSPRGCTG